MNVRSLQSRITALLNVSRPHFWLYEVGTFFLGVVIGLQFGSIAPGALLIWGFYFLFPANLLIYGVNDVFDYETDLLNPKKQSYESVLSKDTHFFVLMTIALITAVFLWPALSLSSDAVLALAFFIFFAVFYSMPPIRAKSRPIVDSIFSAGHYVATGVFGYLLVAPQAPLEYTFVIAAMAWAMAMHVYSAIPDISADESARIATTATLFRQRGSIWYCGLLYSLAAALIATVTNNISLFLLVPYLVILYLSYNAGQSALLRLYTIFPYLNALVGAILTILMLYRVI